MIGRFMHERAGARPVRAGCLVGVLVALAASLPIAGAGSAHATAREHLVGLGAVQPGPITEQFNYMAYYPELLRVHRGDTVRWERPEGGALHTVTFNSPYADRPMGFFRRDEMPDTSAVDGLRPSYACGGIGQAPCLIDDAEAFITSGWTGFFSAVIDLPPGGYTYYCSLHAGTQGTIQVVEDSDPLPAPEEIADQVALEIAQDTQNALDLYQANQTPSSEPAGDARRWTVRAGDFTEDGRIAILAMMPESLEVEPGDEVRFLASTRAPGRSDTHSVAFPGISPLGLTTYLNPTCDLDDERSGLPSIPHQWATMLSGIGCPEGATPEAQVEPWAWRAPLRAPGDAVLPRAVHDSGLLTQPGTPCNWGCDPWTGDPLPSTFDARFPVPGSFTYACHIHGARGMRGTIVIPRA